MTAFSDVCFVVTCKGRLASLRQTLPVLVRQRGGRVVVVDYDCPDGAGNWAETLGCVVVRVRDEPVFHLNRARNLGAAAARGLGHRLLCFIDADTLVVDRFADILLAMAAPDRFLCFRKRKGNGGLGGLLTVPADALATAGGYDERYEGYGRNAADMRLALYYRGLDYRFLPDNAADHIPHGNRTEYYRVKDWAESKRMNEPYLLEKIQRWQAATGNQPPADLWNRMT